MRDGTWREASLCRRGVRLHLLGLVADVPFTVDAWYPDRGEPAFFAKRVCAVCPVREDCLAYALAEHEDAGVWGGTGESIRRRLTRLATSGQWAKFRAAKQQHFARLDHLAQTGRQQRGRQATFGPNATHGNAATAAKGCICPPCRLAQAVRTQRSRRSA